MFFAHPQAKNTKFAKIELKICNKLQNQARIRPNFISGPKSMRFYSEKSLFKGGEPTLHFNNRPKFFKLWSVYPVFTFYILKP